MISLEDRGGGVWLLTISNPRKRNALDAELLEALQKALEPERAPDARVVILRGEGEHFCAGYDLAGLESVPAHGPLPDSPLQDALAALEAHPAVTVACVRGAAFGGGAELASATDLRLLGDDAVWCLPPAKLGVVYAPEGLERVSRLIGPARAKLLAFTGRRVLPDEALRLGLCEEVHPAAELETQALQLASEIASNAPLAVAGMKRVFQHLARGPLSGADRAELAELRRRAFASEDVREGRKALLEKRPPRFTGR